ncbi:Arm DNA-binding domain-containing protein [Cellulophaga baltica]|uniref:Arm DNA-binding domain-containing protein n=1 Tax=Cellulophaga baltica TaxID=76594 RepID=UPI002494274D|nr:Arm DNA-binding domain-containing protein [Cellulophaga baltica]
MATVRVVLRKKKNKAGLYPIAIRITKDRKSSYLNTGQYIDEKYWDERNRNVRKSHPNSKVLNNFIVIKVAEANDKVLKSEMKTEYETVAEIKDKIVVSKSLVFLMLLICIFKI